MAAGSDWLVVVVMEASDWLVVVVMEDSDWPVETETVSRTREKTASYV